MARLTDQQFLQFMLQIILRRMSASQPAPFTPPAPPTPQIHATLAKSTLTSIGDTSAITVTDDLGNDITAGCTATSGTPAVATVSGMTTTAVANGTSVITVTETSTGTTTTVTQTVAQAVASSGISPSTATVARGDTQQFTVTPLDANGHAVANPPTPTWVAADNVSGAAFGTVSTSGLWTAECGGTGHMQGYLHATYPNGVVSQNAGLTIATPSATSIAPSSFQAGSSADSFTITGTGFADDSVVTTQGLTGVTVTDYTRVSATQINGHVNVASNAPVASGSFVVGSAALSVNTTVAASVTAATGGAPTMQASDMVLFDSTSTFASATQLSDILSPTSTGFFPNGNYTGAWRFVANYDGSGKNAIAIDWPQWKHTTLTNAVTGSGTSQTLVVGDTTNWTHDNNLVIDPRGPNSEEIATGNWSIVDATHVNAIATKNHSAGEVIGCEVEHGPYVNKPFTATTLGAYYRIRMRPGKTPQDASGIGTVPASQGDTSAFDYFNDADLSFSGDKRFLLERTGRIYTKYGYSYGANPQGIGFYSDGINYSKNANGTTTIDPDSLSGAPVEWVIYFEPAQYGDGSDLNDTKRTVVSDAVFKQWINNVLTHNYTGQPLGDGAVDAIQSPATFRTPKFDMTEYFEVFQGWVPTPATTSAPGSPLVALGTQYTDATGVVPSTTLNYTITDPNKPDAPYAVFAEVDENGTGSWVAKNLRTWRNGAGGSQDYLVTGLTPGKDYTGKIRFTLRNTTGDCATPTVVSSGTTAAAPTVAHNALYAISTAYAHPAPTFTHGSQALPLANNDWSQLQSGGLAWKTLSASSTGSGSNPWVYQSFGAVQQSGGFFGAISMPLNAQTLPTGTYTMSFQLSAETTTPQYQFAPVLYVWRPSTGAIVGYLIDSATGIGRVTTMTQTGNVVGVNVTNAIAVEEGDVLVWEAWVVGSGSGYVHLNYDGHQAIVDGGTSVSAPQMELAFPAPINFES